MNKKVFSIGFLSVLIGTLLIGIFSSIYPKVELGEAAGVIAVVSIVLSAVLLLSIDWWKRRK